MIFLDPALPRRAHRCRARARRAVGGGAARCRDDRARAPARTRPLLAGVLRDAAGVVAAGGYPLARGRTRGADVRCPRLVIPPGIDAERFTPAADAAERDAARRHLGLPIAARIVLGASRLVPRKGFDVLLDALASLRRRDRRDRRWRPGPDPAGEAGRDRAGVDDRVRFLGRVSGGRSADRGLPGRPTCSR